MFANGPMTAALVGHARKKLRLSQVDLAEHLGVSRVAIYYWEHGDRGIDKVLKLTMACLAERDPTAPTERMNQRSALGWSFMAG